MPSDTESVTHHSVQSDPDPDNAKHKAQHRARMRRHRARRGKGMECLVIRVTGSELDRFQALENHKKRRGQRSAGTRKEYAQFGIRLGPIARSQYGD